MNIQKSIQNKKSKFVLVGSILFLISIILCIIIVINIFDYRSNIVHGVTGNKIKEVKLGMPLEQVLSILGKPFEIDVAADIHNLSCKNPKSGLTMNVTENTDIICIVDDYFNDTVYCCEGNKEVKQSFGKNVTLTYTKPVFLFEYYPMLWVHFDSNYCVCNVFAKRYGGATDDICIYNLSWAMDSMSLKEIQGKSNTFIDEEFDKCFKKE